MSEEPLRAALKRLLLTPDDDGYPRATRVIYAKPDGRERLERDDLKPVRGQFGQVKDWMQWERDRHELK